MVGLEEILGQRVLAEDLVSRALNDGHVRLLGPSGSGKTTVAGLVEARLANEGQVVRLSGDGASGGTRFLAAHRALAGTRTSKPLRDALPGAIASPVRGIPYAGAALAEWVRVVTLFAQRARPEFLSAEQLDLLEGFQRLTAGRRLFLVVDDVGRLDGDTAQLIAVMFRSDVRKAFPFTATLAAVFVEGTQAPRPALGDPLAFLDERPPVLCGPVAKDDFGRVLTCFGLGRPLARGLADDLHAISGGHLEIARQIVKADAGTDLPSLLARGDLGSLMSDLLARRIEGMAGAPALAELLRIASRAEPVFSELELRCAFTDPDAFPAVFRAACAEELLVDAGGTVRFIHDVVRTAAVRLETPQAADLHARMAECLRRMRPGDYAGRLRHLRLAGDRERIAEMAFVVAVRASRGDGVAGATLDAEAASLALTLAAVREAQRLIDEERHAAAVDRLLPHQDGTSSLVQGEVAALIALALVKQRSLDRYAAAVALLDSWRQRREEPELWARLMSILAVALANAGDGPGASRLYARLTAALEEQARFDPSARDRLETLHRKADMFLPSEISEKRIRRAALWFGAAADGGRPRNGFEYGACRLNLAGALYTLGRFAEAANQAAAAMDVAAMMQGDGYRTIQPYRALNNFAIAACRAGLKPAGELADALSGFVPETGPRRPGDRSLLTCNWAALAMLAGGLDQPLKVLEELWRGADDVDMDPYFALHAGANLAVARALAGEWGAAVELLARVEPCIPSLPGWLIQAHRRRHAFMRETLLDGRATSAAAMDAAPLRRDPDGQNDPWRSVGRGLLMSDVQVWSEA